ncbi:hypothetical protein PVK06_035567 [Gossypium arboreum]|uniref:Reverse transcriptase n=1 Tax=Gossypium arboreum TaxID=29729 RepID=A0ABR0NH50_GOSAR|nr:hypothetical protein PVK06_035567 [Gossypium arboreum]
MAGVVNECFSNLFKSGGRKRFESGLEGMNSCIIEDMNWELREVYKFEIQIALKEMTPLKAAGDNGYPTVFFQTFWHIVGKDVGEYYLNVLNGVTVDIDVDDEKGKKNKRCKGNYPFNSWSSVWATKKLLQEGMAWRMGREAILQIPLARHSREGCRKWGRDAEAHFWVCNSNKDWLAVKEIWEGVVLGSMTVVNMHAPTSFAAEAMACLQAVQAGLKFGY